MRINNGSPQANREAGTLVFPHAALSDTNLYESSIYEVPYPIPSTVDQKCLGKNKNQLQGKNYKIKIQTKYKRE